MPKFNPLIMPSTNEIVNQISETKSFKPVFLLENVNIGLDQPALKVYKEQIPHYFNPIPVSPDNSFIDVKWTDHPIADTYANGIPVYTAIRFNVFNEKNRPYIPGVQLEDVYLDNAIMKITQKKRIITTGIMGRDFEIKEYIGMQDYDIEIEGIILSNIGGVYPVDAVKALKSFLVLKASIYVTNPYLNDLLGIDYITIKDFELPQEKGGISYQKYTIKAVNDALNDSDITESPYSS